MMVAGDTEEEQAQSVVALRQFAGVARARQALLLVERVDLGVDLVRHTLLADVQLALLIDRGVQEEREQHRRGAVDGHRDRGLGRAQVEARVKPLGVVERGHTHAGVADFAVDVGATCRILAVQGDRVEGR